MRRTLCGFSGKWEKWWQYFGVACDRALAAWGFSIILSDNDKSRESSKEDGEKVKIKYTYWQSKPTMLWGLYLKILRQCTEFSMSTCTQIVYLNWICLEEKKKKDKFEFSIFISHMYKFFGFNCPKSDDEGKMWERVDWRDWKLNSFEFWIVFYVVYALSLITHRTHEMLMNSMSLGWRIFLWMSHSIRVHLVLMLSFKCDVRIWSFWGNEKDRYSRCDGGGLVEILWDEHDGVERDWAE